MTFHELLNNQQTRGSSAVLKALEEMRVIQLDHHQQVYKVTAEENYVFSLESLERMIMRHL